MNAPAPKRGDLVAIERTSRITYVSAQAPAESQTRVYLAKVTSVTRQGLVRLAEGLDGDTWRERDLRMPHVRLSTLPAASIDMAAVQEAYAERRYPTAPHSSMVPPFDSMHEARAFLKGFLL